MKNKKAAIELSIGTVVIIVLAMTMLIMGIVLVTNIFQGATDLADVTSANTREQLIALFSEEDSNVAIQAGSNRVVQAKSGGDTRNINLGARKNPSSLLTSRQDLEYSLSYQTRDEAQGNCESLNVNIQNFFRINLGPNGQQGNKISFDRFDGDTAFSTIEVSVPEGTPSCTQKIFITVYDGTTGNTIGSEFFTISVEQGGIFG